MYIQLILLSVIIGFLQQINNHNRQSIIRQKQKAEPGRDLPFVPKLHGGIKMQATVCFSRFAADINRKSRGDRKTLQVPNNYLSMMLYRLNSPAIGSVFYNYLNNPEAASLNCIPCMDFF
jgi:hypothetical protein